MSDTDVHVVEDGRPGAPALLLLQNAVTPIALWDPVVPALAGACRVIRVDVAGDGGRGPDGGYDVPAQARRAGAVLDLLGAGRVTAVGHSSGGMVATALAEQRPDQVAAVALIDTGARVELLPGVGHTPMVEDPQTTATLLLDFATALGEGF